MNGEDVLRVAREMVTKRTPYHHHGRHVTGGVDCIGLLIVIARELDLFPDFDDRGYARLVDVMKMRTALLRYLDPIALEDRQLGDILLLRVQNRAQHVGIFAGATMIHAFEPVGCVTEHSFRSPWSDNLEEVFRWRYKEACPPSSMV